MHSVICMTLVCILGKQLTCFFVGQVSDLVENFNIGIFSDTITVMNVKLCMIVLLIELYLFIRLSVTLSLDHISKSQQCHSLN